MKIRAHKIKPGMVVGFRRGPKGNRFDDCCLILATKGLVDVEYTFLDLQQAYGGALVGTIGGKEEVRVLKGNKRKSVISKIKRDVFRNLHDIENLIDMVRLIEAMDEDI